MKPPRLFSFPWRSRRRIAADIDHELAFHVQTRMQELVRDGMSAAEAEAVALREFGDVDEARQYLMHVDSDIETMQRRRDHMRDLWQDVRYSLRRMRAAPVFTATAVATLALGIGANTAVFSVVDAALLRPLPYPNAERVVAAYTVAPFGRFVTSPPDYFDWRAQARSFDEMAAISAFPRTVTGLGEPQSVPVARVTQGFFRVLGVSPQVGRVFTDDEMQFGSANYVVLSHRFWQQWFGGRADVAGQRVEIDGSSYVVVGVMPAGFTYPGRSELWMPMAFSARDLATQRGAHYLEVIALLRRDVSLDAASSDLASIATRLAATYPNTNQKYSATIEPLRDSLIGSTPKRALLVLILAVTLVALIACANVANLVLARGTARGREMAVRLALGAAPRDLAYMALTENLLLALIGGVAGLVLAGVFAGALDALRPEGLREVGELRISGMTAAFTLAISMVAGVLFGLAPALQASRRQALHSALQSGGRAQLGDRRTNRLRSTLVAAEVALAVVLLSGAGLLIKSFARLQQVSAGFDARNLFVYNVSLPEARYEKAQVIGETFAEIIRRTAAVPGAKAVAGMSMLPLDGGRYSISTSYIDGQHIPETEQPSNQIRVITPGALSTLGIKLVRGRDFSAADRLGSAPVVLVNESAARLLWKDADPIGHSLVIGTRFTEDTARARGTVVGIVADIRDQSLAARPSSIVYFPHAQAPFGDMTVIVRAADGIQPLSLRSAARAQLKSVDALLPMVDPRTMDDVVSGSVAQPRFATLLMSIFASLAVVLAVIGVFGVMAYIVGQRSREIGIRMALGASQQRVVAETLYQAAAPLLSGVGAGVLVSIASVRAMANLLYDVAPRDPAVLGMVALGLVGVAVLAAYLPARRASTVDPLVALRAD